MKRMRVALPIALVIAGWALAGGKDHKKKEKKEKKEKQRPAAETIKALETIKLSFEVKDGALHLSWTPATGEASGGVKVAYSDKNDQPLYPFDAYAKWMPGNGHTSCVIPNHRAACDKERYYRICSVEPKNHHAYVALSNVVKVPPIARTGKKHAEKHAHKAHKHKEAAHKDKAAKKKAGHKSKEGEKDETKDAAVYCHKCGAKCGASDNFCRKCGAKLKKD